MLFTLVAFYTVCDRPIEQHNGAFGRILIRTAELKSRICDLEKEIGSPIDHASSDAYFSGAAILNPCRLAAIFLSGLHDATMDNCRRIDGFPIRDRLRIDIGLAEDDWKVAH
ncbi:hypothetical protein [Bradyrhizobium sp. Rc2d]|uniref:hypothetical protein n=1 Tax=Bradyrhizobium sp. Rc2d TaxID=1855321 RepID=UPI00115FD097|nr:hypothetical protein [Bradyrhizobium sp. Rc2d]